MSLTQLVCGNIQLLYGSLHWYVGVYVGMWEFTVCVQKFRWHVGINIRNVGVYSWYVLVYNESVHAW